MYIIWHVSMSYLLSDFLSQVSSSIYPLRDARLSGNCKTKVGIQFRPNKNGVWSCLSGGITPQIYTNNQQRRENDPHLASFWPYFWVGCWKLYFLLFPILKGPFPAEASQFMRCQNGKPKARHPWCHKLLMTWGSMPRDALHCLNTGFMWEKNSKPATKKTYRFSTTPWKISHAT